ncbi:MAG: EF-hand domain-containing protein [Alphaproteobacteria bacterium]|nr:MAG: EF-hand domain-containing protein [Alphaproteobacteria bacterium]
MRQHIKRPPIALLLAASALALSAGVAVAAHPEDDGGKHPGMERMDANKDGKIDRGDFIARHKEMFSRLDLDGNGTVTPKEMHAAHEKMRAEREKRREAEMFSRLDSDGDGKISESELVARGEKAFADLDDDGDGVLSREELRHGMMDRMMQRRHMRMRHRGFHDDGGPEDDGGGR